MNRALKPILVIVLAAAIVGLLDARFHFAELLTRGKVVAQRELATEVLGRYLARRYPRELVVVLSNPFTQKSGKPREVYRYEAAGLRGLQRGLALKEPPRIFYPEIKQSYLENPASVYVDPGTTTPLSYLVADDTLDRLAKTHPDAGLIISLIGFPAGGVQSAVWKSMEHPRFAFLLPDLKLIGNRAAVVEAVKSRKIAALILNRPGAPPEDRPLSSDPAKEFDRRFLLVTPETIDQCAHDYPQLF